MWWIVPRGRRVTWGALLATLFTLVGCGGTTLRRPLVTDETPLGTPRERVVAWHAENGWCRDDAAHPSIEMLRPCTGPDRHRIATVLGFSSSEELVSATVTVSVPPPWAVPPRVNAFGHSRQRSARDLAIDVMEGLASELIARHGAPDVTTWTERSWTTREELIRLEWKELVEGAFVVIEEHRMLGPTADLSVLE